MTQASALQARRVLILSDIHSNLEAFQAVLEDARRRGGFDQVWALGDLVGYGADPVACVGLLRALPHFAVAGNHDLAAIGVIGLEWFNPEAAAAADWTSTQLGEEHRAYLWGLPPVLELGPFTLVHGSPRDPIYEYVVSTLIARECFRHFATRYCLVGHSHLPLVCKEEGGQATLHELPEEVGLKLGEERLLINPGGVGQPRDGDPRASYALYDTGQGTLYHYRVPYDIAVAQAKIRRQGLPERLAARLSYGL